MFLRQYVLTRVVELSSPSDSFKELQQKMEEYIQNGVRLGWLIDRKNKRV